MDTKTQSNSLPLESSGAAAPVPDSKSRAWTLTVPTFMASIFEKLEVERRAQLLRMLLGAVGPLALAVVADGIFFKYVKYARSYEIPVSIEDAALASSQQVYDLVRYVEQSNPRLLEDLLAGLLRGGLPMTAIGASFATMAIVRLLDRSRPTSPPSPME
ncbi:MAG: hypothetical protein ABL931_03075 [Usitatibacteraceae bacterium]